MTTRAMTPIGPGRDYPVLPFFLLIFLSWALWIPAGARAAGKLPFPFPAEIAWLGVFMPFFAGTFLLARYGGGQQLGPFFARFIKWRFHPGYWLYALLAMPLAAFLATVFFSLIGGENLLPGAIERLSDGTIPTELLARYRGNSYESLGAFTSLYDAMEGSAMVFGAGFAFFLLADGGISEEPGWRGYAYPILRDRWGALPAALAVGAVWATWHLGPQQWKILFEGGTGAFFEFLPGYALLYIVGVLPLAIIFSWLYEGTGGSLLACFIIHASFNMTSTVAGYAVPEAPVILGVIGLLWLTVLILLIRHGWRRFSRKLDCD